MITDLPNGIVATSLKALYVVTSVAEDNNRSPCNDIGLPNAKNFHYIKNTSAPILMCSKIRHEEYLPAPKLLKMRELLK